MAILSILKIALPAVAAVVIAVLALRAYGVRVRLTIHDWLWLIAVIALALGWWLEHRQEYPETIKRLQTTVDRMEEWNRLAAEQRKKASSFSFTDPTRSFQQTRLLGENAELRSLLEASNRTIEELRASNPN
jgi:hypothetical protein